MNTRFLHVVCSALLCAVLSAGSAALAQTSSPGLDGRGSNQLHQQYVRGRILVKFKEGVSEERVKSLLAEKAARSAKVISQIGVHIVELPEGADEGAFVKAFQGLKEVEFTETDWIVKPAAVTPNDPLYSMGSQWGLTKIGLPNAWSITTGSSAITIAIIDTGVQPNHPDLEAKLVPGWNVASNIADTSDNNGHGTEVAGAAAAITNNGLSIAGVCWNCMVMPIKVADPEGVVTTSSIASGVTWAAEHGIKVANASFQVTGNSTVSSAAQYLWSTGGILITAAGDALGASSNPDNPYILEIGSTDQNDLIYSWSNTGPYVDLVAPGCGGTLEIGSSIQGVCGTSYSAPIVAGVAALMFSANANITPGQITTMFKQTALTLPTGTAGCNNTYGCGLVNALAAVQAAAGIASKSNTSTVVTSSLNPSAFGQLVTFTAAITPPTATGAATFLDGTTTLGSATINNGKATFATSALAAGAHSITANYSGDSNDNSSVSGAVSQTVNANKANTTVAVASSLNPSPLGQLVTLTARISPSSATGTITFLDGPAALGSSTVSSGSAAFAISNLAPGSHSITANYSGDSNDNGSTSLVLTQTVNAAITKTSTASTVTSSLNPSTSGQSVTLTATVSPSAATGTVTFLDGTATLGSSTLSGGKGTFITLSLAVGSHSIIASYSGDGNNNGSSSAAMMQTVNPASATQPVTTCPSPGNAVFAGCYFPNITLSGNPTFVRTDNEISFSWGANSPDKSLAPGNFSVLWQGNFNFNGGTYAFNAVTSDGMKVYIDGNIVFNQWHNQPPSMYSFSTALTEGNHLVVVQYYEQSNQAMADLWWWQQN